MRFKKKKKAINIYMSVTVHVPAPEKHPQGKEDPNEKRGLAKER